MAYIITSACIETKDSACVEVCPVDCIHSDDDAPQYYINPDECIDCGACAPVCPVEAIFPEEDLGICVLFNSLTPLASSVIPELHKIVEEIMNAPIEGLETDRLAVNL